MDNCERGLDPVGITISNPRREYWVSRRLEPTESSFCHPLFDLRGTRKVEIRHTNFHFSSKKVTSKSRKVEVFDLTIVKKLSTFRPKKAKVEKLKSRKVEKLKS